MTAPSNELQALKAELFRAMAHPARIRILEVGLSTSFFVIQAQRDLAQAKASELSAILAYDLALVDFEALQEAGPAGQAAPAAAPAPQTPVVVPAGGPAAAPAARPATNFLGF